MVDGEIGTDTERDRRTKTETETEKTGSNAVLVCTSVH